MAVCKTRIKSHLFAEISKPIAESLDRSVNKTPVAPTSKLSNNIMLTTTTTKEARDPLQMKTVNRRFTTQTDLYSQKHPIFAVRVFGPCVPPKALALTRRQH